ncbi:DUF3048 domain-containing protein [Candidatus Saccharibacteria bacterium]|nr:MAG: DUF3048 domain-containing protein [Candidatus Saccharibacteria bacterium]
MIDNFLGADPLRRQTPKLVEPVKQEPLRSIHELVAEQEATETAGDQSPGAVQTPTDILPETPNEVESSSVNNTSQVKRAPGFFAFRWTLSKRWTIVLGLVVALLIGGGLTAAYTLTRPTVKGGVYTSKNPPKPAPKITTVASSLSGLQVDPSVNERPVLGVMIENSPDARPQSGLDQAGVVFEAIAEGGITRFLALYQDTQPDYIGPVRSARPYYVQWCMSFDCAYAHAGGSPEALQNIGAWGTKDLPDTRGIFWRISNRYAPHNLYTSSSKLTELAATKGYGKPTLTGFTRKKDKPYVAPPAATATPKKNTTPETRPPANVVNLNTSSGSYNAQFNYDPATNSYARAQGGAAHTTIDAAGTQTQIKSKVVVALITNYGVAADKHSQYGVTGSGQAVVFQDGTVIQASWSKTETASPLRLTDAAGADIALNAGQTWLTALSGADRLSYQ